MLPAWEAAEHLAKSVVFNGPATGVHLKPCLCAIACKVLAHAFGIVFPVGHINRSANRIGIEGQLIADGHFRPRAVPTQLGAKPGEQGLCVFSRRWRNQAPT